MKAQVKEMLQMTDLDVIYPVDWKSLNREQKRSIIRSHTVYQPKYDPQTGEFIKLKARFVANGSTQDKSIYDDISSPTVTTHAVFINAAIAAKERRVIKTIDLPGAYLNVKMSGVEVLMHLDEFTAAILIAIKPEYKNYRREDDGSMIVRLDRALYGCVESGKLWYNELSATLISAGYEPNAKDICVFNKVVDGIQCTITLHVDDLMITCVNETVIDEVIDVLRSKYERPDAKIPVTTGKIHNYLGMCFDFSVDGQVIINMDTYVEDLLKFTNTTGESATPATARLFVIGDGAKLSEEEAEYFHSVVAKLLYLAKRTRPDLLTATGFLAKRVLCSTKTDMMKLERVLKYLNATSKLGLTLRPDKELSINAYVDASYAVHDDMRSQTGMAISLGQGTTMSKSTTQKLNTKSSTEAELVALSDAAGHIIWTRDYLIGQGYNIGPVNVKQDNQSTMALVKRGYSASDKTRHINIRYFFIKDRIDSGELSVEYLPTEQMIADFFTKPLTGNIFIELRDKILGIRSNGEVVCLIY
jgi:histone deacetylase 1/2